VAQRLVCGYVGNEVGVPVADDADLDHVVLEASCLAMGSPFYASSSETPASSPAK
jgi:hypothetical protein